MKHLPSQDNTNKEAILNSPGFQEFCMAANEQLTEEELSAAAWHALQKNLLGNFLGIPWSNLMRLKPRQVDTVVLLAEGKKRPEVAKILGISESTLRVHIERAGGHILATNTTHLIAIFSKAVGAYEAFDPPNIRSSESNAALQKFENLTERQVQVAKLLAAGKERPEAAKKLKIAENTVRVHIENARKTLEASSTPHLIAIFSRMIGITEVPNSINQSPLIDEFLYRVFEKQYYGSEDSFDKNSSKVKRVINGFFSNVNHRIGKEPYFKKDAMQKAKKYFARKLSN